VFYGIALAFHRILAMSSFPSRPDNHSFDIPGQNQYGFDAEMAHRSRRHGCCFFGCCLGCFGFLLLVILGFGALYYCLFSGTAPLIVSPETTIVTEPLKSDGAAVDFHQVLQAMTEPNAPADQNGFRDVLLGYGQNMFAQDRHNAWQYRVMCEQLAIDPGMQPTFSLFRLTPDSIPQWLDEVGKGLDTVQRATAKPHYFIPLVRESEKDLVLMSQPLAVYAFHEQLVDAFRTREHLRYQSEDIAGSWQDTLTTLRLFRRVTINRAWLEALHGSGRNEADADSLLAPVDEVRVRLRKWTPEQLNQGIKDLESLPDWQDRQTTLKMIQFTLLDLMSATNDLRDRFHRDIPEEMRVMLGAIQFIGFDWNVVAKELNKNIKSYGEDLEKNAANLDTMLGFLQANKAHDNPGQWDQRKWERYITESVDDDPSMVFFASGRSKLTGMIVGELLVPWVAGEMFRLHLIEESRCQALRWAMALELFHREKGKYPESLVDLDLKPMERDMQLQYDKRDAGYRIQNKVFRLDVQ